MSPGAQAWQPWRSRAPSPAAATPAGGWLAPAGLAVTAAVIEALADRQKTEYSKRDRSERP
ncbi:hypothetical protein OG205_12425 [Lentzea sp. NBC_00516]|uniref:hypothetical protein n=1 Tax=Lentzea sp. NBC_00516 TaxID=2903582 RepID=UPI002E802FDE|nr:hypothetical protein [Lentzea sp. NBC_00516]WUD27761.1 hypothetical protein OG205_12425 [Lentzea sp. NBC_00516]